MVKAGADVCLSLFFFLSFLCLFLPTKQQGIYNTGKEPGLFSMKIVALKRQAPARTTPSPAGAHSSLRFVS